MSVSYEISNKQVSLKSSNQMIININYRMSRRSQHENIQNLNFDPTEKPNKCQQMFSEQLYNIANQNNLPLKKRFCGLFVEDLCSSGKEEDENNKSMVKKEHKEERNAKIFPGVIRHTSCPDTYLAFYYKYA